MKRAARKHVASAILTADLHLSETAPVSRVDDYIAAQQRKLEFLQQLSRDHNNCPVLCAGDVFHHWRASPWLCLWAFAMLPRPFVTVPGNHDLPLHSMGQYGKSALALLETVALDFHVLMRDRFDIGKLQIVGMPFGELVRHHPQARVVGTVANRRILLIHELVWPPDGRSLQAVAGGYTSTELLRRFQDDFDLIVTGDNHDSFVDELNGTVLVNPGAMLRISADRTDYQPRCYLYYAETNDVSPVDFPIVQGVHDTFHLEHKKERDERIAAYIQNMQQGWNADLSFRRNLEAFFAANGTPRRIQEIIWEHLEAET